jgi:formamidopyrimidine-DNA glycosylase
VPELPDVELYLHALRPRIVGQTLARVRIVGPFLLRSVEPPLADVEGHIVVAVFRIGKRIVWEFDNGRFIVIHLMIAGRFRWKALGATVPNKVGLAAFDFSNGTLILTEAGSKRRASLHVVRDSAALAEHDPGGLDIFEASAAKFAAALTKENHTLKRVLTDPHVFDGIGNSYSDEILHAARLSPLLLTSRITPEQIERLHGAAKDLLAHWRDTLIEETGDKFPEKVTAFREGMAVHGRYGKPCPVCGSPVQRIRYAANEVNYCATCQTGGKLLADRALSRLLKDDWPRSFEELEQHKAARRQ